MSARYGNNVRIGNWSEDEARFDLAAKDYEARRSKGELLHLRKAREKAFQQQPVPHTHAADGLVRFGDSLQLASQHPGARGSVLACNIFDQTTPGCVRVTACAETAAQARNVFVLQPAGGPPAATDGARGPVLRFGDRIALACNPALTVDLASKVVGLQFLLHSQRLNNITGAGRRGRQEADLTVHRSPDTVWTVLAPSGDALASTGEPVRAGAPVTLQHAMSGALLAADPAVTVPTDFAPLGELDPHVQTYRSTAHASMGHSGEVPAAAALDQNAWAFVGSAHAGAGLDGRGFIALTPEALVARARGLIGAACGPHGLRSLSLALAALDQRGTGLLPLAGVREALRAHGATLTADEFALMATAPALAADGPGGLARIDAVLRALRGGDEQFSAARRAAADAAYAHVAAQKAAGRLPVQPYMSGALAATSGGGAGAGTGTGSPAAAAAATTRGAASGAASLSASSSSSSASLTAGDVRNAFDAKFDPRVRAGTMTAVEAAFEFARQWPQHAAAAAPLTAAQWRGYYADVSALVEDDFEFCEAVANAWHVPGAGSWKAKAGKRVLVTFHKGTSTEALLPEAEDIPDDDFVGLCAALRALGFGGIARVKVLETVEVV